MSFFNLSNVFKLQAAFNILNGVVFWLASSMVLEVTNMAATPNLITMTQAFATMFIVVGIIGWQLPNFARDRLNQAAVTFVLINLIWAAALVYHLVTEATSGPTPILGITLNLVFAVLYYSKSRSQTIRY